MNVSFLNFIPIIIIFIIALIVIYLLLKFVKPYEEKLKDYKYQEEYKEEIDTIILTSRIYSNFYIFVTLFILGNIVITFLIPWALSIKFIGFFGVWSLIFFLVSILVGFIFLYKNGLQIKKTTLKIKED